MTLGMVSPEPTPAIKPHRHLKNPHEPRNLSIDREIGAALPRPDVEPTTTTNPLVGKSFAHFIAGGEVYKIEGWRALFKGLGPNLVGVVPARSINFFTYGNGKRILADNFNNGQESTAIHLAAAITAGIVTGTATNPIWLVKTRLQLDKDTALAKTGTTSTRQYRNSWDCIKQTVRHEGIRGLYKGLSASYLGVTESTLQWVLYERMKLALSNREERRIASGQAENMMDVALDYFGRGGAAGAAKLIATAVTYPHEVVRTRLRQAPLEGGKPKYTGLVQCFKLVFREEGMAAMYGGLTSHILKVVPSSMIMFGM
ncbi:Mitoferrin-1 [Arthrobotrys entomopaga]|nr:Mitoferrin-1 [Arthrobotrys entomopaga]